MSIKSQRKQLSPWQLCGLGLVIVVTAVWFFRSAIVSSQDIRHVLLISIDTCRADYLSCYGYPRQTTPNIDKLAEHAVVFENVISPVPITLPSHSSMLTGTIPPYHGVHNNSDYKLAESNVTLAEILKKQGFATGAIISTFVLDSRFGLDQGFDSYNDTFEQPVENLLYFSERRGDETSRFAIQWLEKNKNKKSFLFLHYFDPHIKYTPPEPFASQFSDNLYAGEIAYTDYCIGRVFENLKRLGLYDSTLIILTADHGEMLTEHGEDDHTFFIYQAAVKVPLIVKLPGNPEPKRVKNLVGLIDIVPTLCSLLGIKPPTLLHGDDFSQYLGQNPQPSQNRHLYCESFTPTRYEGNPLLGVVTNRFKYIQTTRPELYDIIDDPAETKNLLQQLPDRTRILNERLKQLLDQAAPNKKRSAKVDLDSQAVRKLRSLGYVAGDITKDFQLDPNKDDPKDLIDFHNTYTSVSDLILQKRYEQAEKLCEKLTQQRPRVYQIYVLLSSIAREQHDLDNAVAHLNRAIEVRPDVAKLHQYLGTILTEQQKFDQAAEHFQKSLQLDPDQFSVHHTLATIFHIRQNYDQAITHLNHALKLEPDSAKTLSRLGDVHAQNGNLNLATDFFKKALDSDPLDMQNHSNLAQALALQGRYDEAIAQLRTGICIMLELGRKDDAAKLQDHLKLITDKRG